MISSFAFFGALETGFIFALVALGIFISFRILDFPDLTVDGSFPLGAAVAASAIVGGINPWLATLMACVAGSAAGVVTALLNVKLNILHLLASILTMIALYSINLRIMDGPNKALLGVETLLSPLDNLTVPYYIAYPIAFGVLAFIALGLLVAFLKTEIGLAMRATGSNPRMAKANGVNTSLMIVLGMALSNALVALAGALFAQSQGSADVTMGVGVIVIGLASVIGGEALISTRTILLWALACVVGSILYRLVIAFALNGDVLGLKAQDLNLITAVLVTLAIVMPNIKSKFKAAKA
ncbi:ABC transporter permease [Oleiphilus sp. HI0071]|uniref:ABC transporter permease n=1 Tax=unclassified Oleiphilus TaxID=2631174 RepID=UPI0007C3791A|nr:MULTISPECIES: ABC transporter permease [unclassified Oleiphilus]KZY63748.1 ABC transporter permease [Oleiphilus sp. HI0065]KZY86476.1 ABC transporter permease [Oleiphilus sp. HI0071]KZZ06032.1 ABC transporter permease [Oleiphilus sp. HI0073]KZZ43554.1 ABC transporter permease [Oleiphilus sp. HI0118]KZZ51409.1 ABC transporter permease [Oleiphilus sp. HI0122]KZZ70742.1 ABC transporter permease [Oleiphilus sp. HI0130]KZZ77828.1 ABC transporter permease [Oleiphilus sp. HI0133]